MLTFQQTHTDQLGVMVWCSIIWLLIIDNWLQGLRDDSDIVALKFDAIPAAQSLLEEVFNRRL